MKVNLISVIIVNYNAAKYLNRSISSVRNQTLKNIEIIIVDDCSTDNSKEIILEHQKQDPRIKTFFSQQNSGGGGFSRNKGIELSSTDYFCYVDCDDYAEYDMCEKLYAEFVNDPDLDIASGSINRVTESGVHSHKVSADYLNRWLPNSPWPKLYKKSYINEYNIRFIEGIRLDDVPMNYLSLFYGAKISQIEDVVYNYNMINENSAIRTMEQKKSVIPLDFLKIIVFLKEHVEMHGRSISDNNYLQNKLIAMAYFNYRNISDTDLESKNKFSEEYFQFKKENFSNKLTVYSRIVQRAFLGKDVSTEMFLYHFLRRVFRKVKLNRALDYLG